MSLFKKIGGLLGLSGSQDAGSRASGQLQEIGNQLKNFTPIRVRNALGTGTYDQSGVNFDLDPRLTGGATGALDFFGNTIDQLNRFSEGDSTARTLALLRERRAPLFNQNLGRLESRLMQQGRLGLATGARAENPELASFFGAEAMADLEAQLAAADEARKIRESLLGAAGGGLGLAMEAAMPSQFMQGLFNAESLRSARDLGAAKIAAGGPGMEYKGAEADRGARASFFGNIVKGVLSDRRLKRNIQRVGTHPLGIGWYRFDYVWGESSEGVMADEVRKVAPHAVHTIKGFDVVDYGAL